MIMVTGQGLRSSYRYFQTAFLVLLSSIFFASSSVLSAADLEDGMDDCAAAFGDQAILRRTYSYHLHHVAWERLAKRIQVDFTPLQIEIEKKSANPRRLISNNLYVEVSQIKNISLLGIVQEDEIELLAKKLLKYFEEANNLLAVLQINSDLSIDFSVIEQWSRSLIRQSDDAMVWLNQEIRGISGDSGIKLNPLSSGAMHLQLLSTLQNQIFSQQMAFVTKTAFFSGKYTASQTTLSHLYGGVTEKTMAEDRRFLETPILRMTIPPESLTPASQSLGLVLRDFRTEQHQQGVGIPIILAPNLQSFDPLTRMINTPSQLLTIDAQAFAQPEIFDLELTVKKVERERSRIQKHEQLRGVLSTWDQFRGQSEITLERLFALQSDFEYSTLTQHQHETFALAYPSEFISKLKRAISSFRVGSPVEVTDRWPFAALEIKAYHFQLEILTPKPEAYEIVRCDFVVFANDEETATSQLIRYKTKLFGALSQVELRHKSIEDRIRGSR